MKIPGQLWALVLVTGESEPAMAVTAADEHSGPPVPSALADALGRAASVTDRERIWAIVTPERRRRLDGPLWSLPASHFVVLPEHRGTAQAILEGLLRIQELDPAARVVMFSCEYSRHDSARDEHSLIRSLRYVAAHTLLRPDELFLLGLESGTSTTGFPGIAVGRDDRRGAFEVAELVDNASTTPAHAATDRRLLLNTGILAGSVRALLRLIERHTPGAVAKAQTHVRHQPHGGADAEAVTLNSQLDGVDFHRHLLAGHERYLSVIPIPRDDAEATSASAYSFETRMALRSDAIHLALAHETSLISPAPEA